MPRPTLCERRCATDAATYAVRTTLRDRRRDRRCATDAATGAA
jgi:hypothetical protein